MTSIPVWGQLTIDCGRAAAEVRRDLIGAVTGAVVSGEPAGQGAA
jgi:hypothetical protein